MPAQDLSERFDVCDREGNPLGYSKARGLVHRDGDWHRSLHVWVVLLGDPVPRVVLQRRSLEKDTWPGAVDVAVGGHLRAGEGVEEALREAEEEIGIALSMRDVVALGRRRRVDESTAGIRDLEVQDVMLARTHRALTELRPDRDEVASVLAIELPDARRLADGSATEVPALEWDGASKQAPRASVLRASEMIAAPDGYFARALRAIDEHLAGRSPAPFVIG